MYFTSLLQLYCYRHGGRDALACHEGFPFLSSAGEIKREKQLQERVSMLRRGAAAGGAGGRGKKRALLASSSFSGREGPPALSASPTSRKRNASRSRRSQGDFGRSVG